MLVISEYLQGKAMRTIRVMKEKGLDTLYIDDLVGRFLVTRNRGRQRDPDILFLGRFQDGDDCYYLWHDMRPQQQEGTGLQRGKDSCVPG